MSERDRTATTLRNVLLIVALAIVSNMWRNPEGWQHYAEIAIVVICLTARERISYYWHKKDRTLWGRQLVTQCDPPASQGRRKE